MRFRFAEPIWLSIGIAVALIVTTLTLQYINSAAHGMLEIKCPHCECTKYDAIAGGSKVICRECKTVYDTASE